MRNPVLVEVMRGALTESRHRGAIEVVDADGASVLALGDVARPVYPRSAVKPLQALPLIKSGAADDGATRPAEVTMAAMIARFLPMNNNEQRAALERLVRPVLRNWNRLRSVD